MLFTEAPGEDFKPTAVPLTPKTKPHGEMGLVQLQGPGLLGAGSWQSWQRAQLLVLAHSSHQ